MRTSSLIEFCDCHGSAQLRQIVMVGVTDLLDEPVDAQALEHAGDLRAGLVRKAVADGFVGKPADAVLPANERRHERLVLACEKD